VDGYQNFRRLVRPVHRRIQEQFAPTVWRYHGQAPAMVPVVAEALAPSALRHRTLTSGSQAQGMAPAWRNE
jgi:hypothetical protein